MNYLFIRLQNSKIIWASYDYYETRTHLISFDLLIENGRIIVWDEPTLNELIKKHKIITKLEKYISFPGSKTKIERILIINSNAQTSWVDDFGNHIGYTDQKKPNNCVGLAKLYFKLARCNANASNGVSVTDMIRHLPNQVIDHAYKYITVEQIAKPRKVLKMENDSIQSNPNEKNSCLTEFVADINGDAIPTGYEYSITKHISSIDILEDIDSKLLNTQEMKHIKKKILNGLKLSRHSFLKLATIWNCHKSGYYYRLRQIKDYNWIRHGTWKRMMGRFKKIGISSNAKYEVKVDIKNKWTLDMQINGIIDCIDIKKDEIPNSLVIQQTNTKKGEVSNLLVKLRENDDISNINVKDISLYINTFTTYNLWEFKCVGIIDKSHFLQTAIYMYIMLCKNIKKDCNIYLFNVLDASIYKISSTLIKLRKMVRYLCCARYLPYKKMTDLMFFDTINKIAKEYYK